MFNKMAKKETPFEKIKRLILMNMKLERNIVFKLVKNLALCPVKKY
jgi:hypothetical protein